MIKKILIDIAYLYFPKGLCNITQKQQYIESCEYNLLNKKLNNFIEQRSFLISLNSFINELNKQESTKDMREVSLLHWQERCLSFELEILEDNKLTKICLHISLLIPYYFIYLVDVEVNLNPYKWKNLPKRNLDKEKNIHKETIDLISDIVEKKLRFNKFPEEYANIIIPDLSFKDIPFGSLNIFNAFFIDENYFNI